jgi:hypothetical protein
MRHFHLNSVLPDHTPLRPIRTRFPVHSSFFCTSRSRSLKIHLISVISGTLLFRIIFPLRSCAPSLLLASVVPNAPIFNPIVSSAFIRKRPFLSRHQRHAFISPDLPLRPSTSPVVKSSRLQADCLVLNAAFASSAVDAFYLRYAPFISVISVNQW